jgi:hypothetical protein
MANKDVYPTLALPFITIILPLRATNAGDVFFIFGLPFADE